MKDYERRTRTDITGDDGSKTPHLFFVFDGEGKYQAFLTDDEACQITERLAKDHGGEVIDRVVDKLIDEGEWPETIGQ